MKRKWTIPVLQTFSAALLLSACTGAPQGPQANSNQQQSVPNPAHTNQARNNQDALVIPNYNGTKVESTNQHGTLFSGMGTSLYSQIGSSGLLADGISSKVESRLHKIGLPGMKALVLGDMVILGESEQQIHGVTHEQHRVLNPYEGSSGKGLMRGARVPGTTTRIQSTKDSPLNRAAREVETFLGGNIRVKAVHSKEDLSAIDRIKSELNSASDANKLSNDISRILKNATDVNVR